MAMVSSDVDQDMVDARERLGHFEVLAEMARAAERLAGPGSLTRLVGAAALGFVLGAGALGVRKLALQATTGLTGDWFATLKAEQQGIDALFDLLMKTEDSEPVRRHLLASKIVDAVARRQFVVEHAVYPALRHEHAPETPRRLAAENFEMKVLMHDLVETPKGDPQWLRTARALHKLVKEHAREEAEIVFPALRASLSRADNRRLTKAFRREGLKLA